jgi:hypothetical protein
MADLPPGMLTGDRHPDQHFPDEENLYRRFSPDKLDGDEISIAAVALPDMSVIRERYGRPEWLLLSEDHADWGVLAFLVRDIPPRRVLWHEGVTPFELQPRHVPHQRNYPHSEVWVFRDGTHICRGNDNLELLDPDFHLRWRECIVLASRISVYPSRPS